MKASTDELKRIAKEIGCGVVASTTAAGSGHPSGSLSLKELLAVLLFRVMKHKPSDPTWDGRDRLVLSKGHAAPALYSALSVAGYIKRDELYRLRRADGRLQGHPDWDPGIMVEATTGALGNGFSIAVGMAIALKADGGGQRIFAILGDGEVQEGIVWEAAMLAAHRRLDNLIAIVDRNGLQLDGPVEEIVSVEPLSRKWEAFGWHVVEADGTSVESLLKAFRDVLRVKGRPKVIIAHTIKGNSSGIMRWNAQYHGKVLTRDQCIEYLRENGCDGWECR